MRRKRVRINKKNFKYYIAALVIVVLLNIAAVWMEQEQQEPDDSKSNNQQNSEIEGLNSKEMEVHFLDVDQGLCILVKLGDEVLIYDGGERDTSSQVVAYVKDLGITEIDYMISSHYDSDHVSGLIGCLNAFDVKNVIGSNYEHNSKLYGSFIDAVKAEGLEMQYPEVGTEYSFGEAVITILSPEEISKDSNANSVAIKLTYGESDFIFTGDADYGSERDMVASGIDIDCEVLSVGHHGSASSSSSIFLENTTPEYVVISCGKGNSYGHPHEEVMELLESMEIDVFRNDVQGTVVATTDGKSITWSQEPCNDYSDGD